MLTALSLDSPFADAQAQRSPQSLNGLWLSDGYGDFFEFQGDSLHSYETTTLSCIASGTATRKTAPGPANEIVYAADDDVFRIFTGTSADTRWFHEDGSASNVMLRRADSRPDPCGQPLPDTPATNYQVFWETFSEQYPFFALRHMDWSAADKKFRPQVTPETNPDELFRILSGMLAPPYLAGRSTQWTNNREVGLMSNQPDQRLLEALLDSWDRNNAILLNLLRALPECGLDARAMDSSPSVAEMFAHIHFVRLVFVSEDAPEVATKLPEESGWSSATGVASRRC